jgi:septum formation protein
MLRHAGLKFFALPADVDEAAVKAGFEGEPAALAVALAGAKANAVAPHYPGSLVIGADQLLVCEGQYFDKPRNMEEAAAHLRRLSGREHRLVTAACVHEGEREVWRDVAEVRLRMRVLSEAFIGQYLAAEDQAVLGSVGAYRLEGLGAQLFEAVEGDYFTVLGLNLLPLLGFLRAAGALAA